MDKYTGLSKDFNSTLRSLLDEHTRLLDENSRLKESEQRERWYDRLVQTKVSGKYPSLKAYVESLQEENKRLAEALEAVVTHGVTYGIFHDDIGKAVLGVAEEALQSRGKV